VRNTKNQDSQVRNLMKSSEKSSNVRSGQDCFPHWTRYFHRRVPEKSHKLLKLILILWFSRRQIKIRVICALKKSQPIKKQ